LGSSHPTDWPGTAYGTWALCRDTKEGDVGIELKIILKLTSITKTMVYKVVSTAE